MSVDLPPDWITLESKSRKGRKFYYNVKTGVSIWTKPKWEEPGKSSGEHATDSGQADSRKRHQDEGAKETDVSQPKKPPNATAASATTSQSTASSHKSKKEAKTQGASKATLPAVKRCSVVLIKLENPDTLTADSDRNSALGTPCGPSQPDLQTNLHHRNSLKASYKPKSSAVQSSSRAVPADPLLSIPHANSINSSASSVVIKQEPGNKIKEKAACKGGVKSTDSLQRTHQKGPNASHRTIEAFDDSQSSSHVTPNSKSQKGAGKGQSSTLVKPRGETSRVNPVATVSSSSKSLTHTTSTRPSSSSSTTLVASSTLRPCENIKEELQTSAVPLSSDSALASGPEIPIITEASKNTDCDKLKTMKSLINSFLTKSHNISTVRPASSTASELHFTHYPKISLEPGILKKHPPLVNTTNLKSLLGGNAFVVSSDSEDESKQIAQNNNPNHSQASDKNSSGPQKGSSPSLLSSKSKAELLRTYSVRRAMRIYKAQQAKLGRNLERAAQRQNLQPASHAHTVLHMKSRGHNTQHAAKKKHHLNFEPSVMSLLLNTQQAKKSPRPKNQPTVKSCRRNIQPTVKSCHRNTQQAKKSPRRNIQPTVKSCGRNIQQAKKSFRHNTQQAVRNHSTTSVQKSLANAGRNSQLHLSRTESDMSESSSHSPYPYQDNDVDLDSSIDLGSSVAEANRTVEDMDVDSEIKPLKHTLVFVIDTNVLIDSHQFLGRLIRCSLPDYGYPTFVVPWVVIQELDRLKNWRKNPNNSNLSRQAAAAVRFIHNHLTARNPRVKGQTPQEANEKTDLPIEVNDDRILHCCLQYQRKFPYCRLCLMTCDVNLRNKATIMGIESTDDDNLWSFLKVKSPFKWVKFTNVKHEELASLSKRGINFKRTGMYQNNSPLVIENLRSNSNTAKSPAQSKATADTSSTVLAKFESIWKVVFDVKNQLSQVLGKGKDDPHFDEAVKVLRTMRPLLSELHSAFDSCLVLSPVILEDHPAPFEKLCSALNFFFGASGIPNPAPSPLVSVNSLTRYFKESKHRVLLQSGLDQMSAFNTEYLNMLNTLP